MPPIRMNKRARNVRSKISKIGKKRRNYANSSSGEKSLAVYRNPFSNATTAPKIPDGKLLLSCGVRLQSRDEIRNDGTGSMYIVLFPGINGGLYLQSAVFTGFGDGEQTLPYDNHGKIEFIPTGQTQVVQVKDIAKWRVVSQGLRLSLLNTSDNNDGYWEAVRVPTDPAHLQVKHLTDVAERAEVAYSAGPPVVPAVAYRAAQLEHLSLVMETAFCAAGSGHINNMINNPSYRSGKLRDLHKQTFVLKPHSGSHEPMDCTRPVQLSSAIAGNGDRGWINFTDYQNLVDTTFDTLIIRLSGRIEGGADSVASRVLAHVVCNQEIVYKDDTYMSRFHSEGFNSNKLEYTRRAICANTAASTRRMV